MTLSNIAFVNIRHSANQIMYKSIGERIIKIRIDLPKLSYI